MAEDYGYRIAYTVLEEGTAVVTSDGETIGTVMAIRADFDDDIFDGIVVGTPEGPRFVEADRVGDLYENAVLLELSAEEAGNLPAL
jgi:hypothetical protein